MWNDVLSVLFPRACIGCDRSGVLLCERCARAGGASQRIVLGGVAMIAALPYAGALRAAIVEFKRGRRAFVSDFAALVAPLIDQGTILVPIPTTRRRIAERGYDQTVLLARALRATQGIGVAEMLCRPRSAAQHGRSRLERLAAHGRFAVKPAPIASAGTLVLFDDVRTTGATLIDAAKALHDGGYDVRNALTLAWTPFI